MSRQTNPCAFCMRKRLFVMRWTSVDGKSVWACPRHTRAAWRYLDWRKQQR